MEARIGVERSTNPEIIKNESCRFLSSHAYLLAEIDKKICMDLKEFTVFKWDPHVNRRPLTG